MAVNQLPLRSRGDAGEKLADRLLPYAGQPDVLVLGLARGGVPVAFSIAIGLAVELDVFIVRKLGTPGHEELAMGAIASGGIRVLNSEIIRHLAITDKMVASAALEEERELSRREELYREGRPPLELKNKNIILVDDGLATGASMEAAILAVRQSKPSRIILAVPVASRSTFERLEKLVNEGYCLAMPEPFVSVGQWYEEFPQTTDEEVRYLLKRSLDREAA